MKDHNASGSLLSERLVNQGLELADPNFRKAHWNYQRLLEVSDAPKNSKLKIFKQYLYAVHQEHSVSRLNISKDDKVLLTSLIFFSCYHSFRVKISSLYSLPSRGIKHKIKQIQRTVYVFCNFVHYLVFKASKAPKTAVKRAICANWRKRFNLTFSSSAMTIVFSK